MSLCFDSRFAHGSLGHGPRPIGSPRDELHTERRLEMRRNLGEMAIGLNPFDGSASILKEDRGLRKPCRQRKPELSIVARIDASGPGRGEHENALVPARFSAYDRRAQTRLELPEPRGDPPIIAIMNGECVNGGGIGAGLAGGVGELGPRGIATCKHQAGGGLGEHVVMAALCLRVRPYRGEKQNPPCSSHGRMMRMLWCAAPKSVA